MILVDSHCHLDYFGEEVDAVVERARAAGVPMLVTICTRVSEFDGVLAIAQRHDGVYCSVGVHPHEAANEPEVTVDRLVELARHPKVVGIGETGLDYFYERSPRDRQIAVFRTHIEAARRAGLPLIVHSRDADRDTAELIAEGARAGGLTGLIHCFSTTRELSDNALKHGFYVSLAGIVTFKNAAGLREIARELPDDRLLVETDAPYLAPVPHRGKRCEPAFVADTAALLAELRGVSNAAIAGTTTANFLRLFRKVSPPAGVAA